VFCDSYIAICADLIDHLLIRGLGGLSLGADFALMRPPAI
jgi:hypothetical protein